MKSFPALLLIALLIVWVAIPQLAGAAGLADRVPEAFKAVFGKAPTSTEKTYWTKRVTSGEKKTYAALTGAMSYAKAKGTTTVVSSPSKTSKTSVPAIKTNAKQVMIVQTLPLFIKIYGNDPTNTEKAWWRK